MAVVNVHEGFSEEGSGARSDDGKTGEVSFDRGFTVLVDDPADTSLTAQFANGIPRVRDSHPSEPFLRCSDVSVRKVSPVFYHVLCRYSAPFFQPGQSPLSQPAKVVWTSASEEVDVDQEVDGTPILEIEFTPAAPGTGEVLTPFDPPLTRRQSDKVLTITRNQIDYDPVFYSTFENTVNSNVLFVSGHAMPPGTSFCDSINGERIDDDQFSYWVVTYVFHFRRGAPRTTDERAWYARLLNKSFSPRVDWPAGAQAGLMPARAMVRGRPAPKPVLIKGDGGFVDHPADAKWREFQLYPTSNFALLML